MEEDGNLSGKFYSTGAVKFRDEEPFIYVARKIGPIYVNAADLTKEPGAWNAAINGLKNLILENVEGQIDVVSGGLTRDVIFSLPVSHNLGIRPVVFRKSMKSYGAGGGMEGQICKGDYVVHVADLITQGKSSCKWIDAIRQNEGVVENYFVVFDRMQGGSERLENEGVKLYSLLEMNEDFFKEGVDLGPEKGGITQRTMESVMSYMINPEKWAREFLRNNVEFLVEPKNISIDDKGFLHIETEMIRGKPHLKEPAGLATIVEGYPDLREEIWNDAVMILRDRGKYDIKDEQRYVCVYDGNDKKVTLDFKPDGDWPCFEIYF